jgi:hypothetical protein
VSVKIAAHIHSEWSYDGSWSLESIASSFARRRYRVVLMCEHSQTFSPSKWLEYKQACAEASRPDLLIVPGIEYADADDALHLPTWGDLPFLGESPDPGALLEAVRQLDGTAVLAHPARKEAWRRVDPAWAPLLTGAEIWNRKYDGWAPGAGAVELRRKLGVPAFVSLDFHNRRQFFPLALRAEIGRDRPDLDSVNAALRKGNWRPTMLGIPAQKFIEGPLGRAARGAEVARVQLLRRARATLKSIRP